MSDKPSPLFFGPTVFQQKQMRFWSLTLYEDLYFIALKERVEPKLGMQQASLEFHQRWVYSQTVGLVANQDNVVWDLF